MKIGRILMKMGLSGGKFRVELIFNGPGAKKHENKAEMSKKRKNRKF